MPEIIKMNIPLVSRPALAEAKRGRLGEQSGEAGIRLEALPEGLLLHLMARPSDGDAPHKAQQLAERLGTVLRKTAPGQWYVAGDRSLSPSEFHALEAELLPDIAISEQSHGRVRISVSGSAIEAMLSKLMAADLSFKAFPRGHGTTLFAGHVAVHAQRIAETRFEITVLRGFASDLWDGLVQASLEFGVEAVGPA